MILIQTYPDPDSPKKPDDFSLEDIPLTLKIARRRKLEEEANHVMDLLIKFHGSPHVSSVNLMTCMGSLALIAKMRPQFMSNVIQGIYLLLYIYILYSNFLIFYIRFNNSYHNIQHYKGCNMIYHQHYLILK